MLDFTPYNLSPPYEIPAQRSMLMLIVCALLSACNDSSSGLIDVLPDEANDRITITNNQQALAARITYSDVDVPIDRSSALPSTLKLAASHIPTQSVSMKLIAQIIPPTVEGELVQATAVSLRTASQGLISYNMRGPLRLGAVDMIKRFDSFFPRIASTFTYNDSDINSVATDGKYVYTAVATDDPAFTYPAVLERIKIKRSGLTLKDNKRIPLSSYAATSVTPTEDIIYATSGDNGEVFAFDSTSLDPLGQYRLHDARWVARDKEVNRIAVVQGTPGTVSTLDASNFPGGSMNLLNSFPFQGANVAESKSTVEIAGGKAFIAAGPDGVQIMCMDTGQIIGSVPIPDPAILGLDPSVVVTNAVSVEGKVMIISNGEAGVYVVQSDADFEENNCNTQNLSVRGRIRLNNLQSANHVAYKSGYLYVAAGLGGVKIIRVKVK